VKTSNLLNNYPPLLLYIIGLMLLAAGGLIYAVFATILSPVSLFFLTLGAIIMLQSSHAFRLNNDFRLISAIALSAMLVIFIDFWPIQLVYVQGAAAIMQFMGLNTIQYAIPHFGGIQALLFVQQVGTTNLVGGEIDNACAGLIALIPCLLLLYLSDRTIQPTPNRFIISAIAICIIVLGNFFRICVELWLPGLGLAPFELVHYPLAFILGILGLTVTTIAGQRLTV
jgi:exosortase/archaeosortase family protein